MIERTNYYKEEDRLYAEYESSNKITAKELLKVLLELDKEIDLTKVIVTKGMPYVGDDECESFSINTYNLSF